MIPIQYVISTDQKLAPLTHVKVALAAGCQWIQLRTNNETSKNLLKIVSKIKDLCREKGATFIIENEVELVKSIDGDGVHLTQGQSVSETRQTIGEGFLIGANISNAAEAIQLKRESADYLCAGQFGGTTDQGETTLSLLELEEISRKMEEETKIVPLCAYGNIGAEDIPAIIQTGMRGITVELHQKDVTEKEVQVFLETLLNA